MTSRRDAVRSLASIAALPFFGSLGVDELFKIRRLGPRVATLHLKDMDATIRSSYSYLARLEF